MQHRIIKYLQNKESFWKTGQFLERRLFFGLHKKAYKLKYEFREEKISSQILIYSLRRIVRTSLLAAVFVLVIELLSYLAKDVKFRLGDDELGLLVSTVVTVSGVFLGLYFTALSAVAGSLFMRAPSQLQSLFLRDRKGKQYEETLVLTLIIGIDYLLLRAFGYEVGFLGPVAVTILAVYAVVRFMALGAQTFYFIHPAEASSTLVGDAVAAIDDATYGGFGKRKSYMQNHYRKQAREAIDTLNSLIDFGVDPVKLSGQQMLSIARLIGNLLRYYLEKKKQIPTKSYWFPKKYEHQKWLISSESTIVTALNSGTSLPPKDVRNESWFEEAAIETILKIFSHLSSVKDWAHAQACMEVIVSVIEDCGNNLDYTTASLVIGKTEKAVDKIFTAGKDNQDEDDKSGHLAILDGLARLPIGILVSLTRYMDKQNKDNLVKEISNLKWSKEKSVYFNKLPGILLPELERTHNQYANEIEIEGHRVSPQWYLQTVTVQQYLIHLKKYYDLVKLYNEGFYKIRIEKLFGRQKSLEAAHLSNRWMEFSDKLLALGWRVQQFIDECQDLQLVTDLPWTSIDSEKEEELLRSYSRQAIDMLSRQIVPLSSLSKEETEGQPDYFGQSLIFGLHAAYDAAEHNDVERLRLLFPEVFLGVMKAKEKVRDDVEGWNEQSRVLLITEPLEDLLTLSGFIKIYSELHQNPELWDICKFAWNQYFSIAKDSKSAIEMLIAGMKYRDAQVVIMPRNGIRFNWDTKLKRVLGDMGFNVDLFGAAPFEKTSPPNHPSPLIRAITRRVTLISFEARNIFFVTFLSKHSSAQGVVFDFPDRTGLEQDLEQEIEASAKGDLHEE